MGCQRLGVVETRGRSGLTVAATVLGENPFCFETVLEESGTSLLTFRSPYQFVVGAPVKLEMQDRLWLGQVFECRAEQGAHRTLVKVEHSLSNLQELLKLAARFA